jgi:hypothetical protein
MEYTLHICFVALLPLPCMPLLADTIEWQMRAHTQGS